MPDTIVTKKLRIASIERKGSHIFLEREPGSFETLTLVEAKNLGHVLIALANQGLHPDYTVGAK